MKKILVVEDDKYLNKLICDQLLLHDFQVESALDGEAAWKILQENDPSTFEAILVDMLLPKIMGADLLTRINESQKFGDLKKYAMSGIYKDASDLEQISALHGITRYWTKPLDLNSLVDEISGGTIEKKTALLRGQLTETPIEKVFFEAYNRAFTGKLHLRSQERSRRIYLFNGHPVGIDSTDITESFGDSLVQMGFVSAEQREEASQVMVERKSFLGETLVDLGFIQGDELFKALRQHTQNLLIKTFFTRQGEFEFEALEELPSHLPKLEFNPFLLMLQAQRRLIGFDALISLYELRWDQFPLLQERMIQVLPLLNLPKDILSLFSTLSGEVSLKQWMAPIDKSLREEIVRSLYLMESIGLLAWASSPETSVDASQVKRMDFSSEFKSQTSSVDDDALMSEYMDMLNKNFYELFGVAPDASEQDIENAYRRIRFDRHPDRFGEGLTGQSKRILDDMLSRMDHAYQTLINSEARQTYDSRVAKKASDSAADSKRFLAAQELYREAIRLLEAEKFSKAKELFERAHATWKTGVEYRLYALYAEFREVFKPESQAKAVSVLQKMRELAYAHSHSDRGFILLGNAHRILNQLDAARDAYRRALEVNPSSDEASNALASVAAEEHKAQRASRTIKSLRPMLFKIGSFVFLAIAGAVAWQFKDQFLNKDTTVSRLDPAMIDSILPVLDIRYKEQVAKITIKVGGLENMPQPVLRSKCSQILDKIGMYGAKQLFLLDEQNGLVAICNNEKVQIFKK